MTLAKIMFVISILIGSTFSAYANNVDVTQMSRPELFKLTGKNLLRVVVACPVSSLTLVASAVFETIPLASAVSGMATDTALDDGNGIDRKFSWSREKTVITALFGSVGGIATDLTKVGYLLLFDDNLSTQVDMFQHTKTSYRATEVLAKEFYSDSGQCGKAGKILADILNEINQRN